MLFGYLCPEIAEEKPISCIFYRLNNMTKLNLIYEDRPTIYAKFNHVQSQDYIAYKSIIQITDSVKQPITIQLEFTGIRPYAPMPQDKHVIKASNLIELYVKLDRWLGKFGYIIR